MKLKNFIQITSFLALCLITGLVPASTSKTSTYDILSGGLPSGLGLIPVAEDVDFTYLDVYGSKAAVIRTDDKNKEQSVHYIDLPTATASEVDFSNIYPGTTSIVDATDPSCSKPAPASDLTPTYNFSDSGIGSNDLLYKKTNTNQFDTCSIRYTSTPIEPEYCNPADPYDADSSGDPCYVGESVWENAAPYGQLFDLTTEINTKLTDYLFSPRFNGTDDFCQSANSRWLSPDCINLSTLIKSTLDIDFLNTDPFLSTSTWKDKTFAQTNLGNDTTDTVDLYSSVFTAPTLKSILAAPNAGNSIIGNINMESKYACYTNSNTDMIGIYDTVALTTLNKPYFPAGADNIRELNCHSTSTVIQRPFLPPLKKLVPFVVYHSYDAGTNYIYSYSGKTGVTTLLYSTSNSIDEFDSSVNYTVFEEYNPTTKSYDLKVLDNNTLVVTKIVF